MEMMRKVAKRHGRRRAAARKTFRGRKRQRQALKLVYGHQRRLNLLDPGSDPRPTFNS
jgi:glutamine synthetase type III